jgi:transcriptional regulator with XRE-family HTH domain
MTSAHDKLSDSAEATVAQGMSNAELGARVREALRASGRTQTELATALGITQAAVTRRLTGHIAWKVTDLPPTAELLGLTVPELLSGSAAATA